ncbi:MAG: response regulator [Candidatus Omnitrophica bacterium]|nr:response regulator [Candidatus Omnitrophota bacterium]MCM8826641.1 response regulator [Candidatus Omnitrophota bacterium]
MKERILVVEDDNNISKLIKYNLEKHNFDCMVSSNAEDALDLLDRYSADLIILDIMLPAMDGFEFCRIIKQEPKLKDIPLIMLTARGEEVDRIVGLELGADDYIVKPFSPRELVLRVKAILKRSKPKDREKDNITRGTVTVDINKHKVFVNQKEIVLTPIEFKLLVTLMQRPGYVYSRETLLEKVWDINTDIYTRTVDTHIKRLREKLGKAGRMIETVVGVGYRFREEEDED